MKIGIPRALSYYEYFPFWKTFYQELGFEVMVSSQTNKHILNLGVQNCVDEACLPVKIFHGHVVSMKDQVDYLFIPRITSVSRREYSCPKIIGIPEMIRNNVEKLPRMIEPNFNLHDKKINSKKVIREMIGPLDINTSQAQFAFEKGKDQLKKYQEKLYRGFLPEEVLKKNALKRPDIPKDPKGYLLILSHPYNLYDKFINMDIINKLKRMGYKIITVDTMREEKINGYVSILPKKMFWTVGRELIGAGLYAMEELNIDGVIYISAFGCGLDSFIADYIERKIKRKGLLPYMQLDIDEHTGQAGVDTRIEAFTEMIERRKSHDSNISTYGECVYRS